MQDLNQDELINLIKQSDYLAFELLYRRHFKFLFNYALKKTGNEDDSADLVQEVFTDFWDKRTTLKINIPVKDYLRSAMFYRLSNYIRKNGLQEMHFRNFELFLEQEQGQIINDTAIDLVDSEQEYEKLIGDIYEVIGGMPIRMKEIFLLSRSGEYSINQIAVQLDLSPQTVKNQISNALTRVRKALPNTIAAHQIIVTLYLLSK